MTPLGSKGGARPDKFDALVWMGDALLEDPDVLLPAFDGGVRFAAGSELVCAWELDCR